MKQFTKRLIILISLTSGFSLISIKEAQSFVPFIFEPNQKSLEETGLNLGKTAAKLLQFGEYKKAISLSILAIRLRPNDERLWSILAESQLRDGLLLEADKSLNQALKLNPQKAQLWFGKAAIALRNKETKQASYYLKKGLEIQPNNAGAYFQLGNAKIMQKNYNLALKYFKKATNIQPDFWEAHNNQALVLFEIDKQNTAIMVWEKVLKIKEDAEPMLALAAAMDQRKPGNDDSIQLAKKALSQNPNYVLQKHQEENLWGVKLQKVTKQLLANPQLASSVERALANSK